MLCIGGDNSVRMEFWLPTSNKLFKDILKGDNYSITFFSLSKDFPSLFLLFIIYSCIYSIFYILFYSFIINLVYNFCGK